MTFPHTGPRQAAIHPTSKALQSGYGSNPPQAQAAAFPAVRSRRPRSGWRALGRERRLACGQGRQGRRAEQRDPNPRRAARLRQNRRGSLPALAAHPVNTASGAHGSGDLHAIVRASWRCVARDRDELDELRELDPRRGQASRADSRSSRRPCRALSRRRERRRTHARAGARAPRRRLEVGASSRRSRALVYAHPALGQDALRKLVRAAKKS
jgi:hypothetical protein